MAHRSRLAGFIIDCRTDDLDAAAAFWSAALGVPIAARIPVAAASTRNSAPRPAACMSKCRR